MAKSESPSTAGSAGPDPADDRDDQAAGAGEDSETATTSGKTTGAATTTGKTVAAEKTGKDAKDTKTDTAAKTGKESKAGTAKGSAGRSGNPAKAASSGSGRTTTKISKREEKRVFDDPTAGPRLSVRAAISLLLVLAGIAWIAYYYVAVRADPLTGAEPTGPGFIGDLADWNYLIGFVAFFLGLVLAAHPSTPLGRGRGVVVGMLFCFLFGLAWICTFYAVTANPDALPVFNDLGQKNLFVGIAAMGVGFVYATRWE